MQLFFMSGKLSRHSATLFKDLLDFWSLLASIDITYTFCLLQIISTAILLDDTDSLVV